MIRVTGYYGGKNQLCRKIIPCLPHHDRYCEPFAGFASVLLNKHRADLEVLGDLNLGTVEVLRSIRNIPETLISTLEDLPWSKALFEQCSPQENAVQALAFAAMSHHRGGSKSGFSQQQCDRNTGRSWAHLRQTSERLQGVKILYMQWRETLELLGRGDGKTLVYLDPPYLSGGEHYQKFLTPDEHEDLLIWCISTRCNVAISGYDSPLYSQYLKDWKRVEFPAKNTHRKDRTEVLWVKG